MDELPGWWAGAQRLGGRLDLPSLAAEAGGWRALIEGGTAPLLAGGLDEGRARAWVSQAPQHTRGTWLTLADDRFPPNLRAMRCPPPVLAVEGAIEALHRRAVALVGTRRCTAYGRGVAHHLAHELAAAGLCVVSGLARGIDGAAHGGALAAKGATAAVVAHGLAHQAPPSHRRLRQRIVAEGGAIVSAFPDEVEPRPFLFPRRNLWIAGLAEVTVVVEAPVRSGALITARCAIDEGRDVAVVPGPLGAAASEGCLDLLADGASCISSVADFVARFGGAPEGDDWLDDLFAGASVDALARRRGLSVVELLSDLGRLEVEGRVVALPGRRYGPSRR